MEAAGSSSSSFCPWWVWGEGEGVVTTAPSPKAAKSCFRACVCVFENGMCVCIHQNPPPLSLSNTSSPPSPINPPHPTHLPLPLPPASSRLLLLLLLRELPPPLSPAHGGGQVQERGQPAVGTGGEHLYKWCVDGGVDACVVYLLYINVN